MKPSVSLIKGTHITAADKRNIVESIVFLKEKFAPVVATCPQETPDYGFGYCRRAGSNKSYRITPRKACAGTYEVKIRENETTDFGRKQTREQIVIVRVNNMTPLYLPDYDQPNSSPNLFTEMELSQ